MLARRIERDAAEDDQLVARLVERPRQDLRRILGVPRGHLAPRLHHARRRVAQPVALRPLAALFARMEFAFESIDGHMTVIGRDLRQQSDLDLGPIYPFDEILAGYAPGAHLDDDLFANKLAFVVLLNFPLTTLEERLTRGDTWSRRQWAEARLAQRFSKRIPAEVNLANAKASAEAAQYVDNYNIWMHNLVEDDGTRL